VPTSASLATSLVNCLIPTIDAARNSVVCIGVRRHVVRLIWTAWTGGQRGRGVETVVLEEALTPVPRVMFINDLGVELQNIGLSEAGVVRVSEISLRYSSHFLSGRGEDGSPVAKDRNFYWEIEELQPLGSASVRRRFTLKGPPEPRADNAEYVVKLLRAENDRTSGGVIR
jgi:hypothetical protein